MTQSDRQSRVRAAQLGSRADLLACLCALAGFSLAALPPTPADAAGACPNEQVREEQSSFNGLPPLPDCRAYEQVSEVEKDGQDVQGKPGLVQASLSGDRVRYFSIKGINGCPPDVFDIYPTYVSSRGAAGWATACIHEKVVFGEELQQAPFAEAESIAGVAADEKQLLFQSELRLVAGAVAQAPNVYEQDLEKPAGENLSLVGMIPGEEHDQSCEGAACVISPGGALAGAGADGNLNGLSQPHTPCCGTYSRGALSADGSRVFFTALPSERVYLREDGQRTVAVSAGAAVFREATPDGSFAFYTEGEDLYRFDAHTGVREPIAVTAAGTGDLTAGSNEVTGLAVSAGVFHIGEGVFGAGLQEGTTVTAVGEHSLGLSLPASETLADDSLSGTTPDVLGVLGSSADGSAVYFAAGGVLAENTREYEYVNAAGEHEKASEAPASEPKVANLYESYQPPAGAPVTTFIARLLDAGGERDEGDEPDWQDRPAGPSREKASRVTPDGETVLLGSRRPLTGYDNSGCGREGCTEFYRYRAGPDGAVGRLTCVSCNPDPALAPVGEPILVGESGAASGGAGEPILTRNLSEDGNRAFFQSPDVLLSGDTNDQTDVYEWEADGEGSCDSEAQDEGCLYLISGASATGGSYFGDASATGDDVFFFTRQALLPTDTDENVDVYDAHAAAPVCEKGEPCEEPVCEKGEPCEEPVCEKGEPCETPPPPASCESAEECWLPGTQPPVESFPATATFSGPTFSVPENLAAPLLAIEKPLLVTPIEKPSPATAKPAAKMKPTRAQQLAAALKACRKAKPKRKRALCEATARRRYGAKAKQPKKR